MSTISNSQSPGHPPDIGDPREITTPLSAFSTDYRAYETGRWALQALRGTNPSWALVDDQVLTTFLTNVRDKKGNQMYPETKPHDPWERQP